MLVILEYGRVALLVLLFESVSDSNGNGNSNGNSFGLSVRVKISTTCTFICKGCYMYTFICSRVVTHVVLIICVPGITGLHV